VHPLTANREIQRALESPCKHREQLYVSMPSWAYIALTGHLAITKITLVCDFRKDAFSVLLFECLVSFNMPEYDFVKRIYLKVAKLCLC